MYKSVKGENGHRLYISPKRDDIQICLLTCPANMDEDTTAETVSMTHATTYKWKKGVCLRALQDVELMFPGILLAGPEKCGEVMQVSDPKTQVGFVRNRNGEGFESVNVRLKANCSLRLQKDIETVITFDSVSPALFAVEDS